MVQKQRIRVYVHFTTTDAPWGGGNNFIRALKKSLPRSGVEVVRSVHDEFDIFLFNNGYEAPGRFMNFRTLASIRYLGRIPIWASVIPLSLLPRLGKAKNGNGRVRLIHRLDGIARLYGRSDSKMDDIQITANKYADFTIFQSRFCLESFRREGYSSRDYAIVGNGADQEIFHPAHPRQGGEPGEIRLAAAAWSGNPMKGHKTLADISKIPGVSVSFLGRWPEQIDPVNVRNLGALRQPEVAKALRGHDAFIHAAQNDPCPNVVYEALSCGLPVLYRESGGTPEIASGYGRPLFEPYDECIMGFRRELSSIRKKIISNLHEFSIERAAREYADVFRKLTGDGRTGID